MRVNLKRPKIFYGWWIVGACFLIGLYVNSVLVYGFTSIFDPVANEFGWTHTQISFAASLRGLEEGFLVPLVGILVDRWGPRRFLISGGIVVALGYIFLGRATSLATFYGAYLIIGFGRGPFTGTVLVTPVVNWFRLKAGVASAIALTGFIAGGVLAPLVVRVVDSYGWRDAMSIFAVGMLVIAVPLSLILRHKPEQYGYSPDGMVMNSASLKQDSVGPGAGAASFSLKQAMNRRAFWHISFSYLALFASVSGLLAHILPYLTSIGFRRSTAGFLVALVSITGITSRLAFGFLADRLEKRIVAAIPFAMMTFAMLCIGYSQTAGTALVIVGLIFFGTSWGGFATARAVLVRELFGLRRFGAILGISTGIGIIGSLAGAPFAGWVFDNQQSYQITWLVFAGLAFLGTLGLLTIPKKVCEVSGAESR